MGLSLVGKTDRLRRLYGTAEAVLLLAMTATVPVGAAGASWNDHVAGAASEIIICWSRSTQYSRTIEGAPLPKDPGQLALRLWIREAVENTWARYANLVFIHTWNDGAWNFCTSEDESQSIIVGFSKTNQAEIGRKETGPTHILFDATLTNRADIELAAINLFGQALELLPGGIPSNHVLTAAERANAQTIYGTKYHGALVGYNGRCAVNENELADTERSVSYAACTPESSGFQWVPYASMRTGLPGLATWFNSNQTCVLPLAKPGSDVRSQTCSTSEPAKIQFDQFKWKIAGELCVVADTPATQGSQLHLADCSVIENARWDFDILSPARVKLSGTDLCAGLETASVQPGAPLKLLPCSALAKSTAMSLTFATSRNIALDSASEYCATAAAGLAVDSRIIIDHCADDDFAQTFHLSGVLTNNGYCLGAVVYPVFRELQHTESFNCVEDPSKLSTLLPSPLEWDYYW